MASPPPLQHPKPTHPPYKIPSTSPPPPSDTPPSQYGASSYQRFSSPTEPSSNGFYNGPNQQQQESYVYQGSHYISPQQHSYANQPSGQYSSQHGYGDWMQSQIGAWGVNDATAAMGVQFGRSAIGAGQEYVEKNLTKWLPLTYLKHSFNVSNLYVARKIRLVLFPWRHKPWARQIRRTETGGQAEGYKPPREDINSPDLYIPRSGTVMSLTTYVLLSGLHSGLSGKFNPSMMGSKSSTAIGVLFLEILLIKFFCYLFNVGSEATMVDLLAYQGYKFVGYFS
ncbi:YIF1-domain-containing protein [Atractiella rhizophila]|nr:YIF1-domain-containing protein [Atractiella rhizophila]